MSDSMVEQRSRSHWAWWVLVVVLLAAVVIDAWDGYLPKLVSSVSFFLAATVVAMSTPPRSVALKTVAITLVLAGASALGYRLWQLVAG
jgi:hypothetical protein